MNHARPIYSTEHLRESEKVLPRVRGAGPPVKSHVHAPALHTTHFRGGCGGRTPCESDARTCLVVYLMHRRGGGHCAPPRGSVPCIWVRDRSAGNITAPVAGVSRPLPIVTGGGHGGTAMGSVALSRGLSRGTLERVSRAGHGKHIFGGLTQSRRASQAPGITGSITGAGMAL